MKLGFCPTMQEDAIRIGNNNNFEIINLQSAARVLAALEYDEIDVGIVGRKAKASEFSGFKKQLGSGYTLITAQKRMIDKNQLSKIEIHTHIKKEIIENKFSELKKVVYHETLEEALEKGDVQLISWDDWNDNFNLFIPVDEYYNKVKKFRTPFVFSKDKELLNNISK